MLSALTYFFDHSIYFARLHHVNPLCKHKCAFLQMKEAPNQKVQEKKPLLKFKNTKKYMCLERIWRKSFRQRPLPNKPIFETKNVPHKIGPWKFRYQGQIALFGPPGTQKGPDTRSKCVVSMSPS